MGVRRRCTSGARWSMANRWRNRWRSFDTCSPAVTQIAILHPLAHEALPALPLTPSTHHLLHIQPSSAHFLSILSAFSGFSTSDVNIHAHHRTTVVLLPCFFTCLMGFYSCFLLASHLVCPHAAMISPILTST